MNAPLAPLPGCGPLQGWNAMETIAQFLYHRISGAMQGTRDTSVSENIKSESKKGPTFQNWPL